MTDQSAQEPTMEEILASIRRIMSEDDAPAETAAAAPEPVVEAPPAPEPLVEAVEPLEQLQGHECTWHPLSSLVPTGSGPLVPPMVTLHIQGGRKEKIRPGDVLGALTADLGYTREQVGKINVNDWSTYVAVDRAIAEQVASRLNDGRIKGKSVKVRVLAD